MKSGTLLRASVVGAFALGAVYPMSVVAEECVNVVHYESSGEKGSMDPADLLSSDDSVHVYAVYNRLVDIDDSFQPVPELAKSWSVSEDGRTWTFELEQGVKFHDGSDFDSGDVVYSFRRLLDPEVGSGAAPILGFLKPEGIQAVDAHTVRFVTDDPIADMPTQLSLKFNLIVSEGAETADLKLNGMGTGPFMQEEFTPGGAVRVLRRNPNYWREGLPKAECLRVTVITEAVSQLAALKSGEADLLMSAAPEILSALRGDENVTLLETGAATSLTFSMQTDKEPFNDNRVREALKAIVDRQEIVDTALLGLGQPGNDNPVPPSWPAAYTAEIKGQDIERARALLAEAGHGDGLTVELYTSDALPGMKLAAQVFQQQAAAAGVTIDIVNSPVDSYWSEIWLNRPFFSSGWSQRAPAVGLSIAYAKGAEWNETNWHRDDFQALLDAASRELDAAKREDLYKQAQELLSMEGGVITPAFMHQVAAMRANCSGYKPHAQNVNLSFEELHCE